MANTVQDSRADSIVINNSVKLGSLSGMNPIPFADAPLIVLFWSKMLLELAQCYDVEFNEAAFKTAMHLMPKALFFYVFGCGAFLTIIQWTGVGTIAAGIANAALTGGFTLALGRVFATAWSENREPNQKEIYAALKAVKPLPANTDRNQ